MEPIRTSRLVLEPQTAAHADEMFPVLSDPALYGFEGEPPLSADWLRQRFERLESRRSPDGSRLWLNWVVRVPGSSLIGYVQATVTPGASASLGYVFARSHWGRGFATESVAGVVGHVARRHNVHSLSAVVKRHNVRSLRLLERLGFSVVPAPRQRGDVERDELMLLCQMPSHLGIWCVASNARPTPAASK